MPEQVRKVIISDGDQELLFLLRNAFVSVGFQVVTVSKNGKKLWETIRNERPDAVICNVFMPHYDVISIMEKLRGEKDINFPVFAILSSFDQDFYSKDFWLQAERKYFFGQQIRIWPHREYSRHFRQRLGAFILLIFQRLLFLQKKKQRKC